MSLEEMNDAAYLAECVKIEPLLINEEFARIPADLAHWNARYALALRRFLQAKLNSTVTRARLQPIVREALSSEGKRVTEAQVDALIESHDLFIAAEQELVDAEVEKNEMYGSLDAIRSKKEMLISLGAHIRAELGGDPALRDQSRGMNGR